MNFRKPKNSQFWMGETESGKTISYVPISEDKLVFLNKTENTIAVKEANTSEFINEPKPTRLVFYCNFGLTAPMLDELESSKIIEVQEICNDRTQIIAYPLPFFDYIKLQDILFDLAIKFKL